MNKTQSTSEDLKKVKLMKPLRLWPGVVIVVLQWFGRYIVPTILPEAMPFGVMGGLVGGLAILVWWAFFSRAPRSERWSAVILMIAALVATPPFLHKSMATGMMGMLFPIYAVPGLSLAFVLWALVRRRMADGLRRATMVATILVACGAWTLVRTGGFTGDVDSDFAWRWSQTAEDRLLVQTAKESETMASSGELTGEIEAASEAGIDWPGFRGLNRDGKISGVRIETDWSASPPHELWRRPVGPGWSSFAVKGNLFYTQEQRGDEEVVACYQLTTGDPVWKHGDPTRFWESNAGAGPRGTPTLHEGRVYSLGATGILNVLDASDGSLIWSRNAGTDTRAKLPIWGFSGSPVVVDDLVIAAASGSLVAYDRATGDPRWLGPEGGEGYSSPHLMVLGGVAQILQLNGDGIVSVAIADGKILWSHPWPGYPILQPAMTEDGDVLISVSEADGIRRLRVAQGPGGWTVKERWTSVKMKPYFDDFVVHGGFVYGFDGRSLACLDIKDGARRWKGGRYGNGQLILLADQDLLLVLSELGELALVGATPSQFHEFARFRAIKGKTWNHPVLAGDILLVRNSQEMAAFRLAIANNSPE